MRSIRVVLIDDDLDDFILIKDLLMAVSNTRYELIWVQSSEEAIAEIKRQAADVYLVDYRLDHRTGLDILNELGGTVLKKAIILLTGEGNREVDIAAMEKGAADYLSKDQISSQILERTIRYCIKRAEDEIRDRESERLQSEIKAAAMVNEAKTQFLAAVSHEIRSPLGAILGYADLVSDPEISDLERQNFISVIKRNGQHLLDIVNDLLDLSRAEAGALRLELGYFKWRNVAEEVIELFEPAAAAKGITLKAQFPENFPKYLKADGKRCRQVLVNLLANAIKFTLKGVVSVSAAVDRLEDGREVLAFHVQDSGEGMTPADQEQLFKPYGQGRSGGTKSLGSGLGLYLSRKLARGMGGDVELSESRPGHGSKFKFFIPAEFSSKKCDVAETSTTAG